MVLAVLMACAAVFVVVPPAAAHDQLLSSDPADGDTVDEMPAAITLTFSGEPMETGAEIMIRGETGQEINLDSLHADGATLSADLPSTLPGGVYDVAWHIVSGDGHPLEGTFSFTVGAPGDGEDAGTIEMPAPDELGPSEPADEDAGDAGSDDAGADDAPADDGASADASDDVANVTADGLSPWVAGLAVLGGLAVVIVLLVVMRRKFKENEEMESRGYRGSDSGGSDSGDGGSDSGS